MNERFEFDSSSFKLECFDSLFCSFVLSSVFLFLSSPAGRVLLLSKESSVVPFLMCQGSSRYFFLVPPTKGERDRQMNHSLKQQSTGEGEGLLQLVLGYGQPTERLGQLLNGDGYQLIDF